MSLDERTIVARIHTDPQGDMIKSAELCATVVLGLDDCGGGRVIIDLTGFRGASPSYFSVLLGRLAEATKGDLEWRFEFSFDSKAQRDAYERARSALDAA